MQYDEFRLIEDCLAIAVRDLADGGVGRIYKQDIHERMRRYDEEASDYALRKMLKRAREAAFLALWGNHYRIRPEYAHRMIARCQRYLDFRSAATAENRQTGVGVL